MPVIKQTMLFEFQGNPVCGFSESWTYQGSEAGAAANLNQLILLRKTVLSQNWRIIGGRSAVIEAVTIGETCKIRTRMLQPLVCPTSVLGLLGQADTPWTALYVQLFKRASTSQTAGANFAGKPRNELLRGIPDSWWETHTLSIPAVDLGALNAFFIGIIAQYGQVKKSSTECALEFFGYKNWCIKRIANRRIGRPFFLLRGRRSTQTTTP